VSEPATLWLLGTIITILTIVITALARALWSHVDHCKDVAATVARIDTNLERVMKDIDKIGPRTHEAINTALAAKAEVIRLTDRLERQERRPSR
jgi:predicted Holliday junction resolvase-like endonuclease